MKISALTAAFAILMAPESYAQDPTAGGDSKEKPPIYRCESNRGTTYTTKQMQGAKCIDIRKQPSDDPTSEKRVTGTIFSCMKDGVRYITPQPINGGSDCKAINYSYVEKLQENIKPDSSWTLFGIGNEVTMFYRNKGIIRKANNVSLWVLSDYKSTQSENGVSGFLSSIARWTIDCQESSITTDQINYYAEHAGRGNPIETWAPFRRTRPTYATPGSMGETLTDTICSSKKSTRRSGT